MFPVAVTAADGSAWVAWQEFDGDDLDVMAARFEGGAWSATFPVSESESNDWAPDLAAAPDGSIWAAWDSYESGRLRHIRPALDAGRRGPSN